MVHFFIEIVKNDGIGFFFVNTLEIVSFFMLISLGFVLIHWFNVSYILVFECSCCCVLVWNFQEDWSVFWWVLFSCFVCENLTVFVCVYFLSFYLVWFLWAVLGLCYIFLFHFLRLHMIHNFLILVLFWLAVGCGGGWLLFINSHFWWCFWVCVCILFSFCEFAGNYLFLFCHPHVFFYYIYSKWVCQILL